MGSVVLNGATSGATTITPTDGVTATLTLPSTTGSLGLSTGSATTSFNAQNTFGFKNRIINGGMVIDQRNAGASVTANDGTFSLDRWLCVATVNGKFTMQQNAGSVTPAVGFINYLGATSSSAYSVGASDFFCMRQRIEGLNVSDLGWGTANAKTVTLSFWVYSSLTGTFGGNIANGAGSRSYPFSYTVSSASTWTQISITITGDTTGTWLTTNGTGLQVSFGLGAGSTYSGTANTWAGTYYNQPTSTVSVVGTSGATFYVTGVQLEVGTQATSFDFRDYGRELYLCQRYCQVYGRSAYANITIVSCYSTSQAFSAYQFVTPMRTAPTLSYSAVSDWAISTAVGSNRTLTVWTASYSTTQNIEFYFTIGTSELIAGNSTCLNSQNTNATFTLSAEL